LAFDDLTAKTYGAIVASAGYSRRKLLGRMIAAQALVHRATLVTFNPDDFSDVPGLSSLVWPSPPSHHGAAWSETLSMLSVDRGDSLLPEIDFGSSPRT